MPCFGSSYPASNIVDKLSLLNKKFSQTEELNKTTEAFQVLVSQELNTNNALSTLVDQSLPSQPVKDDINVLDMRNFVGPILPSTREVIVKNTVGNSEGFELKKQTFTIKKFPNFTSTLSISNVPEDQDLIQLNVTDGFAPTEDGDGTEGNYKYGQTDAADDTAITKPEYVLKFVRDIDNKYKLDSMSVSSANGHISSDFVIELDIAALETAIQTSLSNMDVTVSGELTFGLSDNQLEDQLDGEGDATGIKLAKSDLGNIYEGYVNNLISLELLEGDNIVDKSVKFHIVKSNVEAYEADKNYEVDAILSLDSEQQVTVDFSVEPDDKIVLEDGDKLVLYGNDAINMCVKGLFMIHVNENNQRFFDLSLCVPIVEEVTVLKPINGYVMEAQTIREVLKFNLDEESNVYDEVKLEEMRNKRIKELKEKYSKLLEVSINNQQNALTVLCAFLSTNN